MPVCTWTWSSAFGGLYLKLISEICLDKNNFFQSETTFQPQNSEWQILHHKADDFFDISCC